MSVCVQERERGGRGEGGSEREKHFVNSKDHCGAPLESQLSLKTLHLYKNIFQDINREYTDGPLE